MRSTAAVGRRAPAFIARMHGLRACLPWLAAAVLCACGGAEPPLLAEAPIAPGTPSTPSTPSGPSTPDTPAAPGSPETPAPPTTPTVPTTPTTPTSPTAPTPPAPPPTPIAITPANALALAASALDALWASEIVEGEVALVIGAGSDARGAGSLVSSVNDTDTWTCPKGTPAGTVAATGPSAGVRMQVGDTVKLVATNCAEFAFQTMITVSGTAIATLDSGQLQTGAITPYRYQYHGSFSDLAMGVSYSSPLGTPGLPDDLTVGGSGDMAVKVDDGFGMTDINWPVFVGTNETLQASGTALDLQVRSAGSTRSQRWADYAVAIARGNFVPHSVQRYTVSANVQAAKTDPVLAGGGYRLSTPTPVEWVRSTGTLGTGTLRIDGAANSALRMTLTAPDTFQLEVDANGDGIFESTQSTTVLALRPRAGDGLATTPVSAANASAVAANALEVLRSSELAETNVDLVMAIELDLRRDPSRQFFVQGYDARNCRGGGQVLVYGGLGTRGQEVDYTLTDCPVKTMVTNFVTSGRMTATWLAGVLERFGGPYNMAHTSSLRSLLAKPRYVSPASLHDPSLDVPADYAPTASGDMTLRISGDVDPVQSLNVQFIRAEGTRLDVSLAYSTATRGQRWRNYAIDVTRSDNLIGFDSYAFSGFVESDSSQLGPGGGSYNMATVTRLAWSRWNDTVTSGSFRVRGAKGSVLLVTVTAPNTFRLQVDADGDGTFESESNATMAELKALR